MVLVLFVILDNLSVPHFYLHSGAVPYLRILLQTIQIKKNPNNPQTEQNHHYSCLLEAVGQDYGFVMAQQQADAVGGVAITDSLKQRPEREGAGPESPQELRGERARPFSAAP